MLKKVSIILSVCLILISFSCNTKKATRAHQEQPLIFLHYWSDDMGAGIDTMMSAFSAVNRGYTIKTSGFDHESFKVSIKVMLAGGNPPDLFSYWAGARTQALVQKEYLEPLTSIWNSQELDTFFSPLVSNACKYGGKPYAIPVTQHYVAFFYNKKSFAKYGIAPPKTWGEFESVCETFKNNGVTPIALGARDNWPAQFWFDYLLLRTAGPTFRDSLMDGTIKYTDPKVAHAFTLWNELLEKGYFMPNSTQKEWAEASRSVATGETPMILMGTWIIGLFDKQYSLKQGIDYDYFSFPEIDATIPSTALGPIDAILLPKAGNLKKAEAVVAYFAQQQVQHAMSVGSGALSPAKSVIPANNYPVQKRIHEELRTIKTWEFNYDLATRPEVADLGLALFGKFLNQPKTYPKLLDTLQKEIERLETK